MSKQKIIKIGNSLGVTLPSKFIKKLSLKAGDTVKLVYHDDSSLLLNFPENSQLSLMSATDKEKK